jgi:flagellar export protein FliJ
VSASRLEGVLRVRAIQETRIRGELGMSRGRHRQAVAAEQQTWSQLDERALARTDDQGDNGWARLSLVAEHAFATAGALAASEQNRLTVDAAAVVETNVDQWTIAARRVEALERLHDRLGLVEAEERMRNDANEIDDLVLARFPRQQEVSK